VQCHLCANGCAIAEDAGGFCGLRTCREGKLVSLAGTATDGLVEWYHDALPTNCVAGWVCPAGTGIGYPAVAYTQGPEIGWKNLAVFYASCTLDCLYCQNWHFRRTRSLRNRKSPAEELAAAVDDRTSCICFFGGDPSSQMAHALAAARLARQRAGGRILRICWETNGTMRRADLIQALELALESGGCVKFDLKCWGESLHEALTGASNRAVLESFEFAAGWIAKRPQVPLVVASTLLVPGYVGAEQVGATARFVASLDPTTPYSLLAFHPEFVLRDLPATSRREAEEARAAAAGAGLSNVHVGNTHLLI
jgi:pyruvate formate lyase activating enzyme